MAVSGHFQDEIDAVDNTKTLVFSVDDTNYGYFEWSYSGLTVTGGSDLACEYGASALLEAMGFRFYSPNEDWGYIRPDSIPTNLTAEKQEYWWPTNRVFLAYGHSFGGSLISSRTTLEAAYSKFNTLNGILTDVYPAGHRWNNVITSNQAYFDSNPQLLLDSSTFDLSVTGADYNNLTEICAAHLLNEGLNAWSRTNFDPTDGDTQGSDLVFPFTQDVLTKVRAGTSAIASIGAQAGVPDAQIGLYAYGGHRLPPTTAVSGVYVQVALAFNQTDLTYVELIEQHGDKCDAILIRDYWDTHTWSNGQPMNNGKTSDVYFYPGFVSNTSLGSYDDYKTLGAIGVTTEYSGNWLVNLVQHRWAMRKLKTGSTTYADALNDVMSDLFNDDPAVRDLYEMWSDASNHYSRLRLLDTFDIVDSMQSGWYKTYFQHLCCILYGQYYMPDQLSTSDPNWNTGNDPFPAAFAKHKAHITAVRELDIVHSYAWLRREANGAVSSTYPDLWMYAETEPEWFSDSYLPTESDFSTYYAAITADVSLTGPSEMNTIETWKGAVQPAETGAGGNEFRLWKGAVEPLAAGGVVITNPSVDGAKMETLMNLTGLTGPINAIEWAWLYGLTGDATLTLEGQWLKYLGDMGYTGSVSEMQIQSWKALGYTGTYNELALQFWQGGGVY